MNKGSPLPLSGRIDFRERVSLEIRIIPKTRIKSQNLKHLATEIPIWLVASVANAVGLIGHLAFLHPEEEGGQAVLKELVCLRLAHQVPRPCVPQISIGLEKSVADAV